MGQQQLLLLVLDIVIVGLAVVVGINAFGENDKKANADAMVTDALRIASDAQAWDLKPGQFGGSLDTQTLADVTFDLVGYPNSGGTYSNVNGDFTFEGSNACATAPTIPSGNAALVFVHGRNDDRDNDVCVAIAGTRATDLGTVIDYN